MSSVLLDTAPLVAAANIKDNHHHRCRELFELELSDAELLLPSTVLTEACYMMGRTRQGVDAEAAFLEDVASGRFTLVELTPADLWRSAALVRQYADLPLGAVDASIVAIAERLGVRTVATLDVAHFSIVRPQHCPTEGLVLVP